MASRPEVESSGFELFGLWYNEKMPYKNKEDQQAAWRRYYYRNKTKHRTINDTRKKELALFVDRIKQKPCADCNGEFAAVCMDFDHLGDKTNAISSMVLHGCSKETILREIAKCELVCANCHRIRTLRRRQTGKVVSL